MRQLVQDLRTGQTRLDTLPTPIAGPGHVLIQTSHSLVSSGTERMLVEFGRAGLLTKARQQPERVRQVLDKIKTDGLRPTLRAVFRKLDLPLPLGYCNVGTVLAVGSGVTDLRPGQRVVSNGAHAEIVCVGRQLVAPIPQAVTNEEAAFTVVGAIGLQGVRLLEPTLGETVVVLGLGLIGLLTAQLLQCNGCCVLGIDLDESRCELARTMGITAFSVLTTNPVQAVLAATSGIGADGVIICTATQSHEVMQQAAQLSRRRGRVVLVGTAGLHLNRADFYAKELRFQVSCSYGPGRHDPVYEQQGQDYPLPYVRWTENRNFQAILHLLETGQVQVKPLITQLVPLAEYTRIYDHLGRASAALASLLIYPEAVEQTHTLKLTEPHFTPTDGMVGLIGAGNFVGATLLPALQRPRATIWGIASASGLTGTRLARRHGIAVSTTDYRVLLNNPAIALIVIATRHNQHAQLTIDALQAGKHVFVEKPLAIYESELLAIIDAYHHSGKTLTVGFNRRFAPLVVHMKALLGGPVSRDIPMNVVATMNAGAVPPDSWVHDRAVGGGRLLGEACHLVDLVTHLTGSRVVAVCLNTLGNGFSETADSASLLLRYENGATGVINYFANGHTAYAKERVEVYSQGRTLVLDNFRTLTAYGFGGVSSKRMRQDKGHPELVKRLLAQLKNGGDSIIPFGDIINTTQTMLAALQSGREGRWVAVMGVGTIAEMVEP